MKTNLVFMALGAALMFTVMTLFERSTSPEARKNDLIRNQNATNVAISAAIENKPPLAKNLNSEVEKGANPVLEKPNIEGALESSDNEAAGKKNVRSAIPDDVKKLLTRDANRRAKRFLKKAIGSTNPKLDTLQSYAEIKLRADEQHQNESNIFTDRIDFDLLGKDSSELTPSQQQLIDEWQANQQQLNADLESNRQSYEDSLRNLLNPEELEQYRAQEALVADQLFDRSVESLTESYRESVSDLNDYQHTQLDSIIERAQALEPQLVPIGSTLEGLGYSTSHNNLMDSARYTDVSVQINAILSDQQREQIQENGLRFVFGGISQ